MADTTDWIEVAIESCMAHPEEIDFDHDIATIRHYGSPEYGGAESVDGCCDRIEAHVRTLQARLDQAHWDAISRDQTIENLRAENARLRAENTVLRDTLNWALKDGGWELWYYGWDMPETIRGGSIGNHAEIDEEALESAVAAIIEGKEVTS